VRLLAIRAGVVALVLGLFVACSSSTDDTSGSSGSASSGDSSDGCVKAGGECACGCSDGFALADPPLRDECPKPCDGCGICSAQCCMPSGPADGGADGSDGDAS